MRTSLLSPALALLLLGGSPPPATPWNNSGHRIVSLLAWSELGDATRNEITQLLAQHPRFGQDLQVGLEAGSSAPAAARLAFALAANWPDTVRNVTHPMHKVANHPQWHYVNMPYVVGDDVVAAPVKAPEAGPQDILEAIQKNLADLANHELPAGDRAIALCWVVHLIEDLHQPLHACTLYSAQFPTGDAGGTRFLVTRDVTDPNSQTNLHALWDSLLGNYQLPDWEVCVADGLAASPVFSPEDLQVKRAVRDPKAWAEESNRLAIEHAYRNGTLAGAVDDPAHAEPAPPLPKGYLATAERVAMRRAVLAARRLADVLDRAFAAK